MNRLCGRSRDPPWRHARTSHSDEDRRDGFEHGNWAPRYGDPVMHRGMADGRPFTYGGAFASLRFVDVEPTTTGVLIARYQPAESADA